MTTGAQVTHTGSCQQSERDSSGEGGQANKTCFMSFKELPPLENSQQTPQGKDAALGRPWKDRCASSDDPHHRRPPPPTRLSTQSQRSPWPRASTSHSPAPCQSETDLLEAAAELRNEGSWLLDWLWAWSKRNADPHSTSCKSDVLRVLYLRGLVRRAEHAHPSSSQRPPPRQSPSTAAPLSRVRGEVFLPLPSPHFVHKALHIRDNL